jgi:phosphinothricin acetyltransferase
MAQAYSQSTINVRAAGPDDVPAILEIYNYAVEHTTATADYLVQTLDQRYEWFRSRVEKGFPVFVAIDSDNNVIGWSSYGPYHTRYGYRFTMENSVYVSHLHQRKGAGKLLLAALIDHARKNNVHAIIAVIDSANQPSISLHTAFGFQQVGLMKQLIFKFDRWLDVAYMELLL